MTNHYERKDADSARDEMILRIKASDWLRIKASDWEALQQRVRELEEAAHMAMLELGSHGACPACFNAHSTLRNALTKPEGLK